jgi:hypothetical protein
MKFLIVYLFVPLLLPGFLPRHESVPVGICRETIDSIKGTITINTQSWDWQLAVTNDIKNSYIKWKTPELPGYYSFFTLYDSAVKKMDRRCVSIDPTIGKKGKIVLDSATVKEGEMKVYTNLEIGSLDKLFCRIGSSNYIQFQYKTVVGIYDNNTHHLIKQTELQITTEKMSVGTNKVLMDSVVVRL